MIRPAPRLAAVLARFDGLRPLLAMGGIAFFLLLAVLVATGLSDAIDLPIIHAVRDPALDALLWPLRPITDLGSTAVIGGTALAALALAVAIGPWRHGVAGALTIALAALGNSLVKLAMARARPALLEPIVVEAGFSFPSGHAATSAVGYGVLAVLVSRSRLPRAVRRVAVIGLVLVIFLVGLSRVWLGVHYPTDVMAGWVAGGVVVLLYESLTRGVSREPAPVALDAPLDGADKGARVSSAGRTYDRADD